MRLHLGRVSQADVHGEGGHPEQGYDGDGDQHEDPPSLVAQDAHGLVGGRGVPGHPTVSDSRRQMRHG